MLNLGELRLGLPHRFRKVVRIGPHRVRSPNRDSKKVRFDLLLRVRKMGQDKDSQGKRPAQGLDINELV